jgi:hypothetical protein
MRPGTRRLPPSTVAAVVLAIPYAALVACVLLNIDLGPTLGVTPYPDGARNLPSTLVAFGVLAMAVAALVVGIAGTVGDMRAGRGLLGQPARLAAAVVALATIILSAAGFIIDQLPCWMGVPNCD